MVSVKILFIFYFYLFIIVLCHFSAHNTGRFKYLILSKQVLNLQNVLTVCCHSYQQIMEVVSCNLSSNGKVHCCSLDLTKKEHIGMLL
jgi:hypothetical protein